MNPIKYTSRSFLSILNDINSNPELADKPDWWKNMIAGVGDVLAMYEDAIANQSFLRTAFTRQSVSDLLKLIDYELAPHTPSSGTLLFYIKRTASPPFTIPKEALIGVTSGGLSISSIRFESRADETVSSIDVEAVSADAGTDIITFITSAHRTYGAYTGELLRFDTTGALPAPLVVGTDYYAIRIDSTHIKLASSKALAFAGTSLDITTAGTGTHSMYFWSVPVECYQQTSVESPAVIGTSDGTTEWQEFDLPDLYIIDDTLTLSINSVTWTLVDSFIDSSSTDTHFRLLYKSDGASYVQFGNGTYGAIPGNFDIYADYAYGGGSLSNVSNVNQVTLYGGDDVNVEAVTNVTTMTGGGDEEDIESAKILGPILLKSRDRFVTVEDGEALLLAYGGIARASITPNVYGLLSCQIVCVPYGGGVLSSGTKTTLTEYLQNRSILESIDIRFVDATYTSTNITSQVKVETGYTYADILDMYELAVSLAISELTEEIVQKYQSQGIAVAVAYINSTWSYTFTDENYVQIALLLDEVSAPDFGTSIQLSPTLALVSLVDGVDYVTITVPASFPITFGTSEISTIGTITTTEA